MRRSMPTSLRAACAAALACMFSLASCDQAGDEGGPGDSPGLIGSLPPGPLPTPTSLSNFLASVGGAATQSNNFSYEPSISDNGQYVVFQSDADNLVPGDSNGQSDIFLRDVDAGTTVLISQADGGGPTNGFSGTPFMSGSGRYITWESNATNIVAGDTNGLMDVFLYDRDPNGDGGFDGAGGDLPTTIRVSLVTGGGTQANNSSHRGSVSDTGVVAFMSYASNLVANDTNGTSDIFIRSGTTTVRVSIEAPTNPDGIADGLNANSESLNPCISANAGFVSYLSYATDIVAGDSNGVYDVFRVNTGTGVTDRVSVSGGAAPAQANSWSYHCYFGGSGRGISANGQKVVFSSSASNLVLNDSNGQYDVFVRDYSVAPPTTTRMRGPGFVQANSFTFEGRISNDGARATYFSNASSFDGNFIQDIFQTHLASGITFSISLASDGSQANDFSDLPAISGNGTYVAFVSYAQNLVPDDTNFQYDIFRRDISTGTTIRVSVPNQGDEATGNSTESSYSSAGTVVVFQSDADNLVANDVDGFTDIYSTDVLGGTTKLVSTDTSGGFANSDSFRPVCSSEGRFVAFDTLATDVIFGGDTNFGIMDVVVRDMVANVTTVVSKNSIGDQGNANSVRAAMTPDGRYVAFESDADNFVDADLDGNFDNDGNGQTDVFVHDRQTGTTVRVSVDSSGTEADAGSFFAAISSNGRFVAFTSSATNLDGADANGFLDVFVHDRDSDGNGVYDEVGLTTTTCISRGLLGVDADGESLVASISADGRLVAFESNATNLVAGDTNGVYDIFVHDRQTGVTTRVSNNSAGAEGNGDAFQASFSGDGRYVAFASFADNLVDSDGDTLFDNDTNGFSDVFVHDRQTGLTVRVSISPLGAEGDGNSFDPSLNADGRWVSFTTAATNLFGADVAAFFDIIARGPLVP